MDEMDFLLMLPIAMVLLVISLLIPTMYDNMYLRPIAAEKANGHCVAIGFDQYKEFDRIGFFSKDPVAIKCEYAERYTDLGVRTTPSS